MEKKKKKVVFLIFVFVFMFSIYYIANRDIVYQEHDNRVSTCQWKPCCIDGQTKNDNYACRNTSRATCGECTTPSSSSSSKSSGGSTPKKSCASIGSAAECGATAGCEWDYTRYCHDKTLSPPTGGGTNTTNNNNNSVQKKSCASIGSASECGATAGCEWDYTRYCHDKTLSPPTGGGTNTTNNNNNSVENCKYNSKTACEQKEHHLCVQSGNCYVPGSPTDSTDDTNKDDNSSSCSSPSGCSSFDSQSCTCTQCGGMGQKMAVADNGKRCVDLEKEDVSKLVCCRHTLTDITTLMGEDCKNSSYSVTMGACSREVVYSETFSDNKECHIEVEINGSPQKISKGDNVTATIHSRNCKNSIKVSCGNLSGTCSSSGVSGTVKNACNGVTITASGTGDESYESSSASVGGGNSRTSAYNEWQKSSTVSKGSSSAPTSKFNANKQGTNEYQDCKGDTCDVYKRSLSCGGGTSTNPGPNSYCCVSNSDSDKYWVAGNMGKTCKSGYRVNESINQQNCKSTKKSSYCCIANGGGDKYWVANSMEQSCREDYMLVRDVPEASCKNPVVPKYSYCCVSKDHINRYWVEKDTIKSCPSGYTIDPSITSKSGCNICYADAPILANATKAAMQESSSVELPYPIAGITKAEDCAPPPTVPATCSPRAYLNPSMNSNKSAGSCEGEVGFKQFDGKKCDGNALYTISCETNTAVSFDYGDDKKSSVSTKITDIATLYPGSGVKLGIYVTTKRTCTSTFDKDVWLAAYNRAAELINYANRYINNSYTTDKDQYITLRNEMINMQNDLKNEVTEYKNFNFLPTNVTETASVTVNYTVLNEPVSSTKKFLTSQINAGAGTKTNVTEIKLPENITVHNFTWSNESNPRIVKLIPTKTFFDKNTGNESTTGEIDGGNKIYLDYNVDPTVCDEKNKTKCNYYTLDISVNGINNGNALTDSNDGANVTNNFCKIKVDDAKIVYRPIDVANPFISSDWESSKMGKNWRNDYFDFTSTIHATTWSEELRTIIDLTSDQVEKLKNSTNADPSTYLGICEKYKPELYPNDGGVTSYICNKIK